jgi:prolyl-tRNA synthetase
MFQSQLFYKTYKELPVKEEAKNAQLLIKAGFIEKLGSGIYNFLPLGFLVLEKIKKIIREELNHLGCQELLLANLHPKENWEITNRWTKFDVLFKVNSQTGLEYGLAPTHEEVIFPLVKKIINSYKDLPLALYQINLKYRDELRAKSGLLRNKEFLMKDLYSFHKDNQDLENFKKKVDKAYLKIFKRCGLKAILTLASGGSFSQWSIEFQVITSAGEDKIYYCSQCQLAWNKEIIKNNFCQRCQNELQVFTSIEVGNTFNLGTKFSEDFNVIYLDKNNQKKYVWAGCYGIGVTRLLGAVAEVNNDSRGLIWPLEIAPFKIHILILNYHHQRINDRLKKFFQKVYNFLLKNNFYENDLLIDDRVDVTNGEKFVESDLLGIPYKIIIGERSLRGELELKLRSNNKVLILKLDNLLKWLK